MGPITRDSSTALARNGVCDSYTFGDLAPPVSAAHLIDIPFLIVAIISSSGTRASAG